VIPWRFRQRRRPGKGTVRLGGAICCKRPHKEAEKEGGAGAKEDSRPDRATEPRSQKEIIKDKIVVNACS